MPVGIVPSAELEPVGEPLPADVVPPTNVYPAPITSDDDDEPEAVPASIALNEEGTTIVQQIPTFGSDEDGVVQDDALVPDVESEEETIEATEETTEEAAIEEVTEPIDEEDLTRR